MTKKETKEKRYAEKHGVKKWGFPTKPAEFKELDELVGKIRGCGCRREAVLAALRAYVELNGKVE